MLESGGNGMTVAELQNILEKLPSDARVLLYEYESDIYGNNDSVRDIDALEYRVTTNDLIMKAYCSYDYKVTEQDEEKSDE